MSCTTVHYTVGGQLFTSGAFCRSAVFGPPVYSTSCFQDVTAYFSRFGIFFYHLLLFSFGQLLSLTEFEFIRTFEAFEQQVRTSNGELTQHKVTMRPNGYHVSCANLSEPTGWNYCCVCGGEPRTVITIAVFHRVSRVRKVSVSCPYGA